MGGPTDDYALRAIHPLNPQERQSTWATAALAMAQKAFAEVATEADILIE